MHTRMISIALAVVLGVSVAGCADGANPGNTTQATVGGQAQARTQQGESPQVPARGVIVFDMAHGEIFSPEDTSDLGQSRAVGQMRAAGYEVRVNTEPITAQSLDGVAAVFLAGPMTVFSKDEEAVLDDYLERGGTVVLSIHVPYPVLGMPARWGLPVATGVMQALGVDPEQDPGVFATDSVVADPVTDGVEQVVVVSGWPVKTDTTRLASAKLVVLAAGGVAADTNASGTFDSADLQQPFGVVGVATVGSGRVVVLGDDGIFANMGIVQADNAKLLDNILDLISAPKGA